METVNFHNQES